MFPYIMLFLMGDLYLQSFTYLPSRFAILMVVITSFAFVLPFNRRFYGYLTLAFSLGFAWSAWYAHSVLAWSLPHDLQRKPILITGVIASLPCIDHWQTRFNFTLEKMEYRNKVYNGKTNLQLTWRNQKDHLKVGDRWQLLVRLKPIHGTQNPGAFDYEAWALQKGLRATGYVVSSSKKNMLLAHHWYAHPINQIRQSLSEQMRTYIPQSPTSPWLMALTVGERNGISQAHWQVLRNTGTNHLMAIAGLHIGLMAGFTHWVVAFLWRLYPPLLLRIPASRAGAYAALLIAVIYSALAGFSIPTQRASIMLSIFILTLLSRQKINPWHSWSLALLIVLLLNPISVLTESFWLSFGTIALIIYGMKGRLAAKGLWWKWGRVQWVIGIGLVPLTLSLFHECSIISFIANTVAIPWLGFFILPFCLLGCVFIFIVPTFASLLFYLADVSLSLLWWVLTWFAQLNFATWHQAMPNLEILILSLCAFVLLLGPVGLPGRWLSFFWCMPLLFYKPTKPDVGEFWFTLLDVGQGLAAVVQTKKHILIYDTGPKYPPNFDMGERVVFPFLETIKAKRIDMMVISHGDSDHSGGAQAILNRIPVNAIKTSVIEKFATPLVSYCLAGEAWQWDGVNFSFIYPSLDSLKLGNDSSCVLKISNGYKSILLTGDIEKKAEMHLLEDKAKELAASILIAPHHGSKTSGLNKFITAVHPEVVLYATGYLNRYHFPHDSVVNQYSKIHAKQFNTAHTGALQFKSEKNELELQWVYRRDKKKYWHVYDSKLD